MTLFFENTSDSIRLSLRYGEGKLKRIAINPKAIIQIPLDFSTDEVKECLVNFKDLRVVDKPAKKEEIKEPPKSEEGDKEGNEENNKEGNEPDKEPDKEPEDSSSEGKEDSGENSEEQNNPPSEEKEDNQSSDNNENSSESDEVDGEGNQEGNEPQQKDKKVYLFKDLNALKADELKEFAKAEGFEFEEGISKKNLIRFMIEGE